MAENKRTSEYRKLLPFIAKVSGDVGDDTVGEDVQALLLALETHKTSADHDGRYYTESEMNSLLLLKADKSITLTAGNGLTGGGDLSANRTFNVGAGSGITVAADTVSVNQAYNFDWTGTHSFSQVTYAGSIMPHVSDTYDLGSFESLWRKIFASELSAVIFAKYEQVLLGGWFTVSKGEGMLPEAINASQTQINLGANTFATNDILVFRGLDVNGSPQVEYMEVVTLVSGTTYNVTRNLDDTGANAWPEGTVFANYGQDGDGRIELNAYDTPRISVFSHANTIAGFREQVRIGDLINGWGYSTSTYGGAFGAYESGKANITIDPTNGIRIRNYNQTVIQLTGTEASFENVIKLGTYARLQQGTGTWGSNFTGSAIWNESGIMNIGGWNNNVKQWWGGSDGKFYAGSNDIIIDNTGIKLHNNNTYSGAGRIDFYDAYNNQIGALFGWGETATPLTIHEIQINAFDDRPAQTDTQTSIYLLSESFNSASVLIKAAQPGYYADHATTTIKLTNDYNGNNIQMYGDVTIGNNMVLNGLNVWGNLTVSGTIQDGSGKQYNKIITLTTPATVYSNKQFEDGTTTTYDVQDCGIPATAKMVYLRTYSIWSAASSAFYLAFEKYGTSNIWLVARAMVADMNVDNFGWVEVDSNSRFNVRCAGASTQSGCTALILAYME